MSCENDRLKKYEQYMQAAAGNNSLTAAKALVALYGEGKYAAKNPELVFKYSKVCALQKDPAGMYKLGYLYSKGQGCPKDRVAAVKWMKSAAHAGSEEAKQWIEDRRGHYVDEYILTSTSRKSYSEMLSEVGDQSAGFESEVLRFYRSFNPYETPNNIAPLYTITPTTFREYCSLCRGGTFFICGIVTRLVGNECFELSDGNRSVIIQRGCVVFPDDVGNAVRLCVLNLEHGEPVRLCAHSCDRKVSATRDNYRTVKKWQGPKNGGWEDLLK